MVTTVEEFEGFVERIEGDTAYITLKSQLGDMWYGTYPASKLTALWIFERRRFKCRVTDTNTVFNMELEAIPDRKVSEERERAIEDDIRKALGDDELL